MKKRLIVFILLLALAVTLLPAAAKVPYVVDEVGVLSKSQLTELNNRAEEISSYYGVEVAIAVVQSLNGKTAEAYADDYYDYNGFDIDGILFLISMEGRDWAISTSGKAIRIFTDSDQRSMMDRILESLKRDDYYSAFVDYLVLSENEIADYNSRAAAEENRSFNVVGSLIVSLIIGFVLASIVTGIEKGKLKSVRFQNQANDYVRDNSVRITNAQEFFLYNTVDREARPEPSSGSSTHTSSSGNTHGGSSGKF